MYIPSLIRNLARTYPLSLNEVLVSVERRLSLFPYLGNPKPKFSCSKLPDCHFTKPTPLSLEGKVWSSISKCESVRKLSFSHFAIAGTGEVLA